MLMLAVIAALSGMTGSTAQAVVGNDTLSVGRTSWTCNAPAGSSAKNGISISSPSVISGTVELEKTREGTQWAPVASFNFRSARGAKKFAGVSLYLRRDDPNRLYVHATGFGRDGRDIGAIPLGGPVKFKIDVDESGVLDIQVGGLTERVHGNQFQPKIGELSCSSGQFLFSNLNGDVIDY